MALNLTTQITKEFRGLVEDTFKNDEGKKIPYMTLVCEDDDSKVSQIRISVPEDLRPEIRGYMLKKGCFVTLTVTIKAGGNYSSMKLVSLDDVTDGDPTSLASDKMGF